MKAIIFDLDDTLLWDEKSIKVALNKIAQYVHEQKGISKNEFLDKVTSLAPEIYATYDTYEFIQNIGINPFEGLWGIFDDADAGFSRLHEVAPEYQYRVWNEALNSFGIQDETFAKELREYFRETRLAHPFLYEETLDVLESLKDKYQLALLTNGAPSLQMTKLDLSPELKPYFDEVVISGAFGRGKPDKGIFKHLLGLLNVRVEEAWMVGDNLLTDILGANRVGMTSVWINHKGMKSEDVVPTHEISRLRELLELI